MEKGLYMGFLITLPEDAVWSVASSLDRKASQGMNIHVEPTVELPACSHKSILPWYENELLSKQDRLDLSLFGLLLPRKGAVFGWRSTGELAELRPSRSSLLSPSLYLTLVTLSIQSTHFFFLLMSQSILIYYSSLYCKQMERLAI